MYLPFSTCYRCPKPITARIPTSSFWTSNATFPFLHLCHSLCTLVPSPNTSVTLYFLKCISLLATLLRLPSLFLFHHHFSLTPVSLKPPQPVSPITVSVRSGTKRTHPTCVPVLRVRWMFQTSPSSPPVLGTPVQKLLTFCIGPLTSEGLRSPPSTIVSTHHLRSFFFTKRVLLPSYCRTFVCNSCTTGLPTSHRPVRRGRLSWQSRRSSRSDLSPSGHERP